MRFKLIGKRTLNEYKSKTPNILGNIEIKIKIQKNKVKMQNMVIESYPLKKMATTRRVFYSFHDLVLGKKERE